MTPQQNIDAGLIADLWRVVTLRAGFNTTVVMTAAAMLGVAGGVVGSFAMLRRRSLMSDVLSHATLPGIAGAFMLAALLGADGRSVPILLAGGALSGVLGLLTVQFLARFTRLGADAAMGVVLSVFFGAGVVLLSVVQSMRAGNQGGIKGFIYGQAAAMQPADAVLMACVALFAVAATGLFFKELSAVCFDEGFARSGGWPVWAIDLLIMALVVVVTVAGLQAVGLIMVVAMLIIPPAAARFWTDRLLAMVALSGVIGGIGGYLGAGLSALAPRSPAGAVIVLTTGALFLLSMLAAPRRGLLAALVRRQRLALRIGLDHLVRALHEGDSGAAARVGGALRLRLLLTIAAGRGLARREGGGWRLTERGVERASDLARRAALWERYLVLHADVAASHADWSADALEHVLPPETIRGLEDALREEEAAP